MFPPTFPSFQFPLLLNKGELMHPSRLPSPFHPSIFHPNQTHDKVLHCRLSKALEGTISEAQCAFVGGRQLIDAALVANEVVDDLRRRGRQGILLRLDFKKAYDRLIGDSLKQ